MNLLNELFSFNGLSSEQLENTIRPIESIYQNLDPFNNYLNADEIDNITFIESDAQLQNSHTPITETTSNTESQSEIESTEPKAKPELASRIDMTSLVDVKTTGLVPTRFWEKYSSSTIPLSTIIKEFFNRRTSNDTKFIYKLYNALKITSHYPQYEDLIGVYWVSNDVFVVKRHEFAVLNAIKIEKGALFHQHGNFTTHGFQQIDYSQLMTEFGGDFLSVFDEKNDVFCRHKDLAFTIKTTGEQILDDCPYRNDHKKLYRRINGKGRYRRVRHASRKKH